MNKLKEWESRIEYLDSLITALQFVLQKLMREKRQLKKNIDVTNRRQDGRLK